jgi:hypothetical protein
MVLPNKIPPISPNEAGTLLRVSTNNKKLNSDIAAINDRNTVENTKPPLWNLDYS